MNALDHAFLAGILTALWTALAARRQPGWWRAGWFESGFVLVVTFAMSWGLIWIVVRLSHGDGWLWGYVALMIAGLALAWAFKKWPGVERRFTEVGYVLGVALVAWILAAISNGNPWGGTLGIMVALYVSYGMGQRGKDWKEGNAS
ncbi:MAG: hypothetical protein GEU99_16955 [Luteitalea sp.]|nr:hypothetical protein [Luteitalea sp.]